MAMPDGVSQFRETRGRAGVTPAAQLEEVAAKAAPTVGSGINLRGLAATALRSFRDIVARVIEIAALESRAAGMAMRTTSSTTAGTALDSPPMYGATDAGMSDRSQIA
jgi:hypothetical protein